MFNKHLVSLYTLSLITIICNLKENQVGLIEMSSINVFATYNLSTYPHYFNPKCHVVEMTLPTKAYL